MASGFGEKPELEKVKMLLNILNNNESLIFRIFTSNQALTNGGMDILIRDTL